MHPIREIFRRIYEFSTCSSDHCPLSSSSVNHDDICDVTLHSPDIKHCESVKQSILEWELGTSSKAMISCKAQFEETPNHSDYIGEVNNDQTIIRCNGWRTPTDLKYVTKPPFLVFDLAALYARDVTDLSTIPYDICIYGDRYRLGGATSYVSRRTHFVGYICLVKNKFLFYDGLPSSNPTLSSCPEMMSMENYHFFFISLLMN